MRFSTILIATATIYFAATSIYASPIPSCKGGSSNCAIPEKLSVRAIIPSEKYAQGSIHKTKLAGVAKTSVRRRNIKRNTPAPAGPVSSKLNAAAPVLTSTTTPVTSVTGGTTTGLGTASQGIGAAIPMPGPKDTDVNAKLAETTTNAQTIIQALEAATGGGLGGPSSGAQQKPAK
ncbi:hypothetical protein BDA99DRAFT_557533 [Phascolomyces articulosus]|uniref:Uncharacterized protein n=1 Tax=Phascolomyces articulosus TaxID=60185 RepID=A0AAD5K6B7_9FUNG|nr:hypothetical protein BDA99DRAFT_557533 [Phascolomyces articulosus]